MSVAHKPNEWVIFMPVVLRHAGFAVSVLLPPREHGPAHVHVRLNDAWVAVSLSPVSVKAVSGMRDVDIIKAIRLVEGNLDFLVEKWRLYHGS